MLDVDNAAEVCVRVKGCAAAQRAVAKRRLRPAAQLDGSWNGSKIHPYMSSEHHLSPHTHASTAPRYESWRATADE